MYPRYLLLVPSVLVLGLAVQGSAEDLSITTRLSVGVAKGYGLSQSGFESAVSGSYLATYSLNSAVQVEVPALVNFALDGSFSVIAGPALVYSRNSNELNASKLDVSTGTTRTVSLSATDDFTALGAKIYGGIGYGGKTGWHGEFLPYVGVARVQRHLSGTIVSKPLIAAGPVFTAEEDSTASGTAVLYGATLGGYYTFAQGLEIGARAGVIGSAISLDGQQVGQSGGLFAAEIGYRF